MGNKRHKNKKKKPVGRRARPVLKKRREDCSQQQRNKIDWNVNTVKKRADPMFLNWLKQYLGTRKWTSDELNGVDCKYVLFQMNNKKVVTELQDAVRWMGFEGAEMLSGKNGDNALRGTEFCPTALYVTQVGGLECNEHTDYDVGCPVSHAFHTLYVVLETITAIKFEIDYDTESKKVVELESGDALVFPGRYKHIVNQASGHRKVLACHFITNKFKTSK